MRAIRLAILGFCFLSANALAGLPTLAVIDFTKTPERSIASHGNIAVVTGKHHKSTVNPILAQEVTRYLTNSHKFDVLDRTHIALILKEQEFASMDTSNTIALEKTGQLLGADFLVTGLIENTQISTKKQIIPYTEKEQTLRIGDMQINVTVVNSTTGKIVASVPVIIHKQIVLDEKEPLSEKAFELKLMVVAAKSISASIINTIFPPRVMQIDGDVVYINRGEASEFDIGDVLTIYQKGDALTDPDTGRTVGYTKKPLGTVTVTSLNTQYTIANILSGDPKTFTDTVVIKESQPEPTQARRQPLTSGSSDKPFTW